MRHYLLKLLRQSMAGKPLPLQTPGVAYSEIDSRMVIVPTDVTFQQVLEHSEWTWGEAGQQGSRQMEPTPRRQ